MDAYTRALGRSRRRIARHPKKHRTDVNRIANPATHKPAVRGVLREPVDTGANRELDVLRTLSLPYISNRSPYQSSSRQRGISGTERRSCMDAARSHSDANMFGLPVHPGFYNSRPHIRNSYHFPPHLVTGVTQRKRREEPQRRLRTGRGRRRPRSVESTSSPSSSAATTTTSESSIEETIRVKRTESPRSKRKSQVETLEARIIEVERLRMEAEAKAEKAHNDLKQLELRELYMKQIDAKGEARPKDEPHVIFPSSPSRLASPPNGLSAPGISGALHTRAAPEPPVIDEPVSSGAPLLARARPHCSGATVVQRIRSTEQPPEANVPVEARPRAQAQAPAPSQCQYLSSWESLPQPTSTHRPDAQPQRLQLQQQQQQQQHHVLSQSRAVQHPQQWPNSQSPLPRAPVEIRHVPQQQHRTAANFSNEMIPVTRVLQEAQYPIVNVSPPPMPALSPLAAAFAYLTDKSRPSPPQELLPDSMSPSSKSCTQVTLSSRQGPNEQASVSAMGSFVRDRAHMQPRLSSRTAVGSAHVTLVTSDERERKMTARDGEMSDIISSRQLPVTAAFHPSHPIPAAPSTQGDPAKYRDENILDVRVASDDKMRRSVPRMKEGKNRKMSRCGC